MRIKTNIIFMNEFIIAFLKLNIKISARKQTNEKLTQLHIFFKSYKCLFSYKIS